MSGEDQRFPKFPSLRSLCSLRLVNCSFQVGKGYFFERLLNSGRWGSEGEN